MNPFRLLFGFQGRVNRAKFWLAILIGVVFYAVGSSLVFGLLLNMALSFHFLIILPAIVYVPILVSNIAVGIKRLHDRNKSGWWLLVFYLLPVTLLYGGVLFREESVRLIAWSLALAISIWALIELGFLRGTRGTNRFGPEAVLTYHH